MPKLLFTYSGATNAAGTDFTATTTDAATSYGYDANGAQTRKTTGEDSEGFEWDFEGHLTRVEKGETNATRFTYDASGNRIQTLVRDGAKLSATNFLVDENTQFAQVLEERDAAGTLQARYVYGQGFGPLLLQRVQKNAANVDEVRTRFLLADGHGSVRQLLDEAGVVTDSYFFDAFGSSLAGGSGNTVNPYRYNGQQTDATTGGYYLRARYYQPGTGRFLSHDPEMGSDDDPVSLHRYLYAGGDGINGADPSGRETLAGAIASLGVNTTLAGVLSNALTIGSRIATVVSFANLWSDYQATGTVDPIDAGLTLVSAFAPTISRLGASFLAKAGISFGNLLRSGAFDKFVIQKVGDVWIKTVNPQAFKLVQNIARSDLSRQVNTLSKLGDMAPEFSADLDEGILLIKDVGEFGGTKWQALKIWWKGSARMRNWINDIRPHNIGANGQIFDPALPAYQQLAYGAAGGGVAALLGGTGYYLWLSSGQDD